MRSTRFILRALVVLLGIVIVSCQSAKKDEQIVAAKLYPVDTQVKHLEWTKDAVIYEVNIRQHTQEGTFKAFEEHIPRMKEMGIDILWLMPVFPIGELNRKAAQTVLADEIEDPLEREKYLGSYYAIKDYMTVNPEFGTEEDFRALVQTAHNAGMYVILDIAVNHTAWDHAWVTEKPDYYTRIPADSTPWNSTWMAEHPEYYKWLREIGMTYPIEGGETDWWDTADLNYKNSEMRKEMLEAMKYWVAEFDIDGYRCDVAGKVPCDFWNDVRVELDNIKPMFMLAEDEAEHCLLEKAFDMNYAWELHHIMNKVAQGEKDKTALEEYYHRMDSLMDPDIYRMNFITNHDENSWNGTIEERMGDAAEVFAMLSFTLPGMPLLYSGQEMGLSKRLLFFERDPMVWKDSPWTEIYTDFITLRTDNPAFWSGNFGGSMNVLELPDVKNIFAFERIKDDSRFIMLANLGETAESFSLPESMQEFGAADVFAYEMVDLSKEISLGAWQYKVLQLK